MSSNFQPDNTSSQQSKKPTDKKRSMFDWRYGLLIAIALILGVLAIYFSPIKQSRNFYDYADQSVLLGIPHFWDVISNLGFLVVGIIGLIEHKRKSLALVPSMSFAYQLFFIGLIGAFLGSSFYHWVPGAFSLMIDRIPITVCFISLYCIIIAEYLSPKLGKAMLFPMLAYGVVSVIYWYMTDITTGRGDMAPYVLVQLLPIIHIPLIVWLYPNKYYPTRNYLYALVLYVVCKWAESNDDELHAITSLLSGHTIKHILAAVAGYYIYLGWKKTAKKKPCN